MDELTRRMVARMASRGARHPEAAAIAVAARGRAAAGLAEYARTLGLETGELAAIEAGDVPVTELPAGLLT